MQCAYPLCTTLEWLVSRGLAVNEVVGAGVISKVILKLYWSYTGESIVCIAVQSV